MMGVSIHNKFELSSPAEQIVRSLDTVNQARAARTGTAAATSMSPGQLPGDQQRLDEASEPAEQAGPGT